MSDAGPATGTPDAAGPGSARPRWLPFAIAGVVLLAVVVAVLVSVGGDDGDEQVDTAAGTSSLTTVSTVPGGAGGTATTGTSADGSSGLSDETTVPVTGATIGPETTVPSDETTVPSSTPSTDTTVPGEPVDCGSITPSGWPTTAPPAPGVLDCLVGAFEAGTPATLLEVSYGAPDGGGDPAYRHEIRYDVIGKRLLRVTTDWATATAPDAPDGVTVQECTELAPDTMWPAPGGCTVVS